MKHPVLPTQEQFDEWDSEYFDGERQNFDVMMIKAFQAGADKKLEQVEEWLYDNLGDILVTSPFKSRYALARDVIWKLDQAMRSQGMLQSDQPNKENNS